MENMKSISKEDIKEKLLNSLKVMYAKELPDATMNQKYEAFSKVIRDYISEGWLETNKQYREKKVKQVYYLSMEFLIGKLLERNLINLGIRDLCKEALADMGIDFGEIVEEEPDAGLGNGGLGRLAACFIDSLSSLELPGHGCGIRYKYGLFRQEIRYKLEITMEK